MATNPPDPHRDKSDPTLRAYLRTVKLHQLDLSHIKLPEDERPEHNWLSLARWIGRATAMLWRVQRRVEAAPLRHYKMPQIPPAVIRWGTFLGGLGLGAFVLFGVSRDAEWQGNGYSTRWFVAVGLSITTGILLGRWLIMQANAARQRQPEEAPEPIVLPPWVKWISLTGLVIGGLFAAFGHHLFNAESQELGFAMSGVGFAVGILGAIWLARRFDEVEAEIRANARDKARSVTDLSD